jgi:hypothetical protein
MLVGAWHTMHAASVAQELHLKMLKFYLLNIYGKRSR